jgi:hypothetical protein
MYFTPQPDYSGNASVAAFFKRRYKGVYFIIRLKVFGKTDRMHYVSWLRKCISRDYQWICGGGLYCEQWEVSQGLQPQKEG